MATRKSGGSAKVTTAKLTSESKVVPRVTASHIMPAPKGPRTLTHRQIKRGVEKVFEERYGRGA